MKKRNINTINTTEVTKITQSETRLKEHKDYKGMYWVSWDDGDTDFFNITWAKEHLRRMDEGQGN